MTRFLSQQDVSVIETGWLATTWADVAHLFDHSGISACGVWAVTRFDTGEKAQDKVRCPRCEEREREPSDHR